MTGHATVKLVQYLLQLKYFVNKNLLQNIFFYYILFPNIKKNCKDLCQGSSL